MKPTAHVPVFALAAIVLLGIPAAPARAQEGTRKPPTPEEVFKRLDKNGDGFITPDELPEQRRESIKRFDRNGDGKVSLAEHLGTPDAGPRPAASARNPAAVPEEIEAKRDLPYAETDNPRQKLDLYLPKKRNGDKPLPVLVFIHGGGWKGGDKAGGLRNVAPFVSSGDYAGVSVGYRLTNEAQWPAQIHDCKAAIRWIRGHAKEYGLDPEHIAVWGTSAGGHLVSMLGTSGDVKELDGRLGKHTELSSRVQAVVNYFGPENFLTMVKQPSTVDRTVQDYPEALLLGGRVQDIPDAAKHASPVTYISADDPPFLTAHGTKDPLVPFAQAEELHQDLRKAKVASVLITMKEGGHGFASAELNEVVKKFLAKYLRGEAAELSDATFTPEAAKKN